MPARVPHRRYQDRQRYVVQRLRQVGFAAERGVDLHWLKDPQAMRSGTIEPNRNMNDEAGPRSDRIPDDAEGLGKQEAKK